MQRPISSSPVQPAPWSSSEQTTHTAMVSIPLAFAEKLFRCYYGPRLPSPTLSSPSPSKDAEPAPQIQGAHLPRPTTPQPAQPTIISAFNQKGTATNNRMSGTSGFIPVSKKAKEVVQRKVKGKRDLTETDRA